jgi:hypothetical protein
VVQKLSHCKEDNTALNYFNSYCIYMCCTTKVKVKYEDSFSYEMSRYHIFIRFFGFYGLITQLSMIFRSVLLCCICRRKANYKTITVTAALQSLSQQLYNHSHSSSTITVTAALQSLSQQLYNHCRNCRAAVTVIVELL